MTYTIGDIFKIDEEYEARADFANKNGLMIKEIEPKLETVTKIRTVTDDDGQEKTEEYKAEEYVRYFQLVEVPAPTEEELIEQKRAERDAMLASEVDPVVSNPLRWAELSDEVKELYKNYRIYLLNIPQDANFPYVDILTFERWKLVI